MKKMVMCAAFVAVFALCLSAMAAGTLQPADMTADQIAWSSENRPGDTNPPAWNEIVADDWKCSDGQPIGMIGWWGAYHPYKSTTPGPVDPPAFLPTSFILRQYADNAGTPGNLLNEVLMPIADCSQAYFGTAPVTGGFYNHVFGYEAVLPTPWTQTKDSIYWFSVQAQFSRDPVFADPPTGDGYLHWDWVSTPAGDFEGRGQHMINGGPWAPIWLVDPTEVHNFAFEILSTLPVDLTPNKTTFKTTGQFGVSADVLAISTPCYPFVRITQPNGQTIYFVDGGTFYPSVTPFLGLRAGPITVQTPLTDIPLLAIPFKDLPAGTYILQGGAVDAERTTSVDDLKYVGSVDVERIVIEQ